jgi:hypothetical protein
MYDLSGELTVILITVWWLQEFGKDLHKQAAHKFDVERFISAT